MASVAHHLASFVPNSHHAIVTAVACLLLLQAAAFVALLHLPPLPHSEILTPNRFTHQHRSVSDWKPADRLPSSALGNQTADTGSSDFAEGGNVPSELEEEESGGSAFPEAESGGSAFPEAESGGSLMDPAMYSIEELARRDVIATARSDMLRRIDAELRRDESGGSSSQAIAFVTGVDGNRVTLVRGVQSGTSKIDPPSSTEIRIAAAVDLPAKRQQLLDIRAAIVAVTNGNASELDGFQQRLLDLERQQKRREVAAFVRAWRAANPAISWPPSNALSLALAARNRLPPREPRQPRWRSSSWPVRRRFRSIGDRAISAGGGDEKKRSRSTRRVRDDEVVIVLYVHNRPAYLRRTLAAMRRVEGIRDALLIVSHDGYYPEMDALVRAIDLCPVKQIYFPFSPHLFTASFPAAAADDCRGRVNGSEAPSAGDGGGDGGGGGGKGGKGGGDGGRGRAESVLKGGKEGMMNCSGQVDQFGRFRGPKTISLKHHWWWAMNTVWDGLEETKSFGGHVVWVEEDHLLFPNALSNLRALLLAKNNRCPHCIAANLAPSDVKQWEDDGPRVFSVETMGNIGYCFNRSVWDMIHQQAEAFCYFDDYNWDVSMSGSVLKRLQHASSIRWSRTSARHFGKCGFHSGKGEDGPSSKCSRATPWWKSFVNGVDDSEEIVITEEDRRMSINSSAPLISRALKITPSSFRGWGGWGDGRDIALCMEISKLYRS